MKFDRSAGILFVFAALAAIVSGCETPAPPEPVQIVEAPPPPPPPPPPPVALSTRVIELASSYRAVMGALGAMTPNFTDGPSVANAVRIGSSYEPDQLQQGAVAYAAIAALQEPNFVASVRKFAADQTTRVNLAQQILANPYAASTLPNAESAAGLAIAALDGMGARVTVAGKAVKQSAYDVQRQAWSKAPVADADMRLANAKTLSATRQAASIEDVAELRQASVGVAAMSLAGDPVNAPYSDVITRGLALAALAALGHAGDENDATLTGLLATDNDTGFCLNMAKLNLYQCLAVAKPHYEDIFCLGQHAMIDTGQCVSKAAASPNPAYVEPAPIVAYAPPPAQPARR
jgi:hypothetical protein